MINFENGKLEEGAYVIIDGVKYPVVMPRYSGKTPVSAENLNYMQDLIKEDIDTRMKKVYQKVLTSSTYELNIDFEQEGITAETGDIFEIVFAGSVAAEGSADTNNVGLLLLPNGQKNYAVRRASFFEAHNGAVNIQNLENQDLALPRIARVFPGWRSMCRTILAVSQYIATETDYNSPQGTSASYLGKTCSVVGPITNLTSLKIQAISTEMHMTDGSRITIFKR